MTFDQATIPVLQSEVASPAQSSPQRLCVLASGSKGNCAVIETRGEDGRRSVILLDLGLSPKATNATLAMRGLSLADIDTVLMTHFDKDHCHESWRLSLPREIQVFVHHEHMPWVCSKWTNRGGVTAFANHFYTKRGISILPHLAPHDEHGSVAFRVASTWPNAGDVGYATDVGRVTPELVRHLRSVEVLAIESNYCPKLQHAADRPAFLKRRIMGGRGHLSNHECAQATEQIRPLASVVLLHLSQQANTEDLARQLHDGRSYSLTVSSQDRPTGWIEAPRVAKPMDLVTKAGSVLFPAAIPARSPSTAPTQGLLFSSV